MKNNNNESTPMTSKKKSIKNIINEYTEEGRERRYASDEAFHKAITPDRDSLKKDENKGVIYRNGIDTRFLVYVILLLCFGAVIVEVIFTSMPAMYVSVLLSHVYVISNPPRNSACYTTLLFI